jgi:hypothetical protein
VANKNVIFHNNLHEEDEEEEDEENENSIISLT